MTVFEDSELQEKSGLCLTCGDFLDWDDEEDECIICMQRRIYETEAKEID